MKRLMKVVEKKLCPKIDELTQKERKKDILNILMKNEMQRKKEIYLLSLKCCLSILNQTKNSHCVNFLKFLFITIRINLFTT